MRHLIIMLLAAAASILSTAPAQADLGDQLFKLLPNDGAAGDRFGSSVAIRGATAIVGAPSDGDNGLDSGSAYLFDTTTGRQLFNFQAKDAAADDRFGVSVAISGETAIVGAWLDDDNGNGSGSAYLFDTTTGRQIAKLVPNDGAELDFFGISAAISGDTAIVGAVGDDENGTLSGSAYLFNTATGRQVAKLLPNDGAEFDFFGWSAAIGGALENQVAIVGAPYHNDNDNGSGSGSAYLFDTTTGQQIAKLLADDGEALDNFGISVAISGAIAIIGARFDDDNGDNSGSAYLFDISDPANPTQIAKLLPDDGAASDYFGYSVAICGATAIVGAHLDDDNGDNSGSAYLFDISDPANPTQIAKLLPDDGAADNHFGGSIAISGDTAIVGAQFDDDNGDFSGSAYLFDAASPGKCPWDLDRSGSVGTGDLLALLAQWGTDGPADFDENGAVGTSDLLILLANWGPCP